MRHHPHRERFRCDASSKKHCDGTKYDHCFEITKHKGQRIKITADTVIIRSVAQFLMLASSIPSVKSGVTTGTALLPAGTRRGKAPRGDATRRGEPERQRRGPPAGYHGAVLHPARHSHLQVASIC